VSTGTWSKDNDAGAEIKKTDLTVEYRSIDVSGGTAEAVGLTGNFFITVRFIVDSLHLLALGDAGPLYVTTVFNRPAHPGKFKAVHTRHEFTDISLPGYTSRPEQSSASARSSSRRWNGPPCPSQPSHPQNFA
jgi:hypothetical protein